MGALLVAVALLGVPMQDQPLGEISKEQLFQEIRAMGYVVLEEKDSTLLVDGANRVHLGVGLSRSDDGALIAGGDRATGVRTPSVTSEEGVAKLVQRASARQARDHWFRFLAVEFTLKAGCLRRRQRVPN